MSNHKLCIDCKHHYETELSDRQLPDHFCKRILGIDIVTGNNIYLGKKCSYERNDGKCGVEARYFEPKVSN